MNGKMRSKDMKPKSDPSTPIHLDSGQHKELSYLIESLRQDIRESEKNEAGNGLSEDAGERRKGAAVRRAGHWGHHAATFRRNLVSVA
jgi:hypothetical protein